jgi:hypothetical protein
MRIYRHAALYGSDGIFGIGKSKYFSDFIQRPGGGELIPGTKIKRMRTIPLGPQARGVSEAEVERVVAALTESSSTRAR